MLFNKLLNFLQIGAKYGELSENGKTVWDLLASVPHIPRLFGYLLTVSSILVLLIVLIVHIAAEPGSEVSLMGIVKYTKSRNIDIENTKSGNNSKAAVCSNLKSDELKSNITQENMNELQNNLRVCEVKLASTETPPSVFFRVVNTFSGKSECVTRISAAILKAFSGAHMKTSSDSVGTNRSRYFVYVACSNVPNAEIISAGPSFEEAKKLANLVWASFNSY